MTKYEEVTENLNGISPACVGVFSRRLAGLLATGRRVYVVGNGGSASSASHFTADLCKLGFDAVCLSDNAARVTAIVNDSGWDKLFTEQMGRFHKGDALVVFTVHGCEATKATGGSANIYEAARLCRDRLGDLYVFSGNDGGHLAKMFKGQYLTVKSGDCDVVEGIHSTLAHMVLAEIKDVLK